MLEFIFQGTPDQFDWFKRVIAEKCPEFDFELDKIIGDEFHLSSACSLEQAFEAGMILAACYAHWGHLEGTRFETSFIST